MNIFAELLILLGAPYRKAVNKNNDMVNSMDAIAYFQFFNMAIVLIFAVINLKFWQADHFIGFLDGQFDDFNIYFFQKMAPQYVIMMFYMIWSVHILSFLKVLGNVCYAWFDRKFSMDYSVTRQSI